MKKLLLASLLCLAAVMVITPAYATETWDPHLHGVDEGLAAGALPPPGVYFINDSYFAPVAPVQGPDGHQAPGVKLFAYVDVPILLWVPGCKFLGADYGVAIAEPFDYVNLMTHLPGSGAPGVQVSGSQWGAFNTVLLPYILSWKLPCDFRIKTALAIGVDDPTSSKSDSWEAAQANPTAPSGNGYWSFTPEVGISWLHAGWNASAELFYTFGLKNNDFEGGYSSGNQFAADYTLTYTCGKWTFGAGAAQEQQVFNDSNGLGTIGNSMARLWTAGPIVGYNFGPCSLMLTANFQCSGTNDPVGAFYNVRLVVPLWK
ncbi:MAG: transporter [Syntrophobacteraceae bacterium]